jgi:HD-GYP domain-containing protein (c-di-GMP phosphodiesterase class II)
MAKQGLDAWAIRYAARMARRLELSEGEIHSLVRTAAGLETSTDHGAAAISRTQSAPYDRSGSADARAADDVRIGAVILAVVRSFQAFLMMGRDREQALAHLKRRAGNHLDPEVVGTLLTLIREDAMAALVSGRSVAQQRTFAA